MTIRDELEATGIRRLGGPRNGFRYRGADGRTISPANRRRIDALKVPPRWTEVRIAKSAKAPVQAVGRDPAGRWQYLYAVTHAKRRSRAKFERMLPFATALPALRQSLTRDLELRGLPRDKALACAVAILATCFVRAGSEEYAEENGSFGLATLRHRHVQVHGARIRLAYPGKHGVRQRHEIRNAALARIVSAMLRLPGVEVLKYRDDDGHVEDVSRWQINHYIKRAMGRRFTARDFRTWAGTLICAGALHRVAPSARTALDRRSAVTAAIRETAVYLGNTPAVCRSSYVHPAVLRAFERGVVVKHAMTRPEILLPRRAGGLDRCERELVALLGRGRQSLG